MTRRRPTPPMPPDIPFDAAYYQRFYEDPRTRVADPASVAPLADFLFSYLAYLDVPVTRVLDIGCGTGLWRDEVRRLRPGARYVGVDNSEHACRAYGWRQGSVTTYRTRRPFDLVLCHDVLHYLDDTEAEAALRNLAKLTGSALHLRALTREDWETNCDQALTDGRGHLRSAAWYRERLRRDFLACGGGLYLKGDAPAVLFELEVLR